MKAREAACFGATGALLAAAPLAAFVHTNGYPLLSAEAAVLLAACLAVGALVGFTAALSRTAAALALGAGAALCIDLLYGRQLSTLALLAVALACVALAAVMRRRIVPVVAASSFVFLVSTIAIPTTAADDAAPGARASAAKGASSNLPLILHLILDEHIGIAGLPAELPATAALGPWLTDSYLQAGFRLYPQAYSEYFATRYSLANLFNFSSQDAPSAHLVQGATRPHVLQESSYFRHLASLGYELRVYQSDHIDLCRVPGVPYAKCVQYHANSIASLQATALGTVERVSFILNSFVETSTYLVTLRMYYARLRAAMPALPLPAWNPGVSRVGPLAVLPVLEQLEEDLRTASTGQVFVAHLLLPHYPYVLEESCRPRASTAQWLYNMPAAAAPEFRGNSAAGRAERYTRYAAQVRCQQSLVARLWGAIRQAGLWDQAIVLVHGDHGSRIVRRLPTGRNAARLTREDFNDGFSTLFALRKPGLQAGVVAGLRPLQELLAEAFEVPLAPLTRKVYLGGDEGRRFAARPLEEFR